MAREKFLFFNNASDDAIAIKSNNINAIDQTGDGALLITAVGGNAGSDVGTTIALTCTSGTEKDIMRELSKIIVQGSEAFYVIADDDASEYLANILTCGAIAEGA
jgi:hypothetical protein|tara:strand:+ start:64 stop:378 length:315 start_codon:yes stop_codon:yes gene_type:complete